MKSAEVVRMLNHDREIPLKYFDERQIGERLFMIIRQPRNGWRRGFVYGIGWEFTNGKGAGAIGGHWLSLESAREKLTRLPDDYDPDKNPFPFFGEGS